MLRPAPLWLSLLAALACTAKPKHDRPTSHARQPVSSAHSPALSTATADSSLASSADSSLASSADSARPTPPTPSAAPTPPLWTDEASALRRLPTDGPRVYAKTRHIWIYPEPDLGRQWIGFLWTGGSARLKTGREVIGRGCPRMVELEPRGWVCVDDKRATLNPDDPLLKALYPYSPRLDSPWPHRYGESRGMPRYLTLPSSEEQRAREPGLRDQLERLRKARAGEGLSAFLKDVDLAPAPERALAFPAHLPSVHEAHGRLTERSTVAYSAEARRDGRDFLLTSDYEWVPKDRVAVYPAISFQGVHFDAAIKPPLAFFRTKARPSYLPSPQGAMQPTGREYARLSYVLLSGKQRSEQGHRYLETSQGDYVDSLDAVLPELAKTTPWGSPLNSDPTASDPQQPAGRATWISVSIDGGWLLAYEGHRPVFATLISPGRGGPAQRGRDPLETAATPTGRFKITGKFASSTMIAPGELIHSEVPYPQNFTGPYAIHTAYWHDNWGNRMSGGCINVSPLDGYFLFHFTEPVIPEGWYGRRWLPHLEPATTLLVNP